MRESLTRSCEPNDKGYFVEVRWLPFLLKTKSKSLLYPRFATLEKHLSPNSTIRCLAPFIGLSFCMTFFF